MKLFHPDSRSIPIEWEDVNKNVTQKSNVSQNISANNSVDEDTEEHEGINNLTPQNKGENKMERKTRLSTLVQSNGNDKVLTDTEKIHRWLEFGQSVLLIGAPGIGKTQRLYEMYPNRVVPLRLTNNMLPEFVKGSYNMATGQEIPPNFARQIILMCATEEEKKLIDEDIQNFYDIADAIYERSKLSDEKIVLLVDELLNVKPSTQDLVFDIVLNKRILMSRIVKLPKNVVVVATGNPQKDSSAAQELTVPLQQRFDHILNMQPKVSDWLYDYAMPRRLHRSVVAYMLSHFQESGKSNRLKDITYFFEDTSVGDEHTDAFGQKGKTNNPRTWESVSNFLYAFEESAKKGEFEDVDIEDFLLSSLKTMLRSEWAESFFKFYNIPTLTVEDVVTGNYTPADAPQDSDQMFALISSLLAADENDVQACRQYINDTCGGEFVSTYDLHWGGDNEDRLLILADLPELKNNMHFIEKSAER